MKLVKEAYQNRDIPRRSTTIACGLLAVCLFFLPGLPAKAAAFLNLDFESSPSFPPGDNNHPFTIYADALPGWTVHRGNTVQDGAWANEFILDSAGVALLTLGPSVIEGQKSAYLQSTATDFGNPSFINVAISQVGDVPLGSQSLRFKTLNQWYSNFPIPPGPFEVSLGGTGFSLIPTLSNGGYVEYAANVSPWAGQTAELSIRVLASDAWGNANFHEGWAVVDSITFSPSPVPEPSAVALIGLGGLFLLGFRRRKTVKELGTK